MTPNQNVQRVEEFAVEPARSLPHVVDADTMKHARRQWVVDNWVLTAMFVCMGLFAAALAVYVFVPAARTLVGN